MESDRSEQVVDAYKKQKLAISALRRMRELVHGFERGRVFDARMAWVGIAIILLALGTAAWLFFSGHSITLS